jgi:peroxiredoxin Q/BCP
MPGLLTVGAQIPAVEAKDQNGKTLRIGDLKGRWIVLYFYPKDETFGCTREACGFRDLTLEFEREGAVVVGVSGDDVESHASFAKHRRLKFPLLADPDGALLRQFGTRRWYGWSRRVTYLVDPDGRVAKVYRVRAAASHPEQVLDDLRAFKNGQPRRKTSN